MFSVLIELLSQRPCASVLWGLVFSVLLPLPLVARLSCTCQRTVEGGRVPALSWQGNSASWPVGPRSCLCPSSERLSLPSRQGSGGGGVSCFLPTWGCSGRGAGSGERRGVFALLPCTLVSLVSTWWGPVQRACRSASVSGSSLFQTVYPASPHLGINKLLPYRCFLPWRPPLPTLLKLNRCGA